MGIRIREIPNPDPWDTNALALAWFVMQSEHELDCNIRTRVELGRGCTCAFGKCYARLLALVHQEHDRGT